MAEKPVIIDGGDQLLVADVTRGPKGSLVLRMRFFDAAGRSTFVLEDVDAKALLPLMRAIIPDQPALTTVLDGEDSDA